MLAKVSAVRAEVGLSINKDGIWQRVGAGIDVQVEPSDDIRACFKRAYQLADEAVGTYLEDLEKELEEGAKNHT